MNLSLLLLIIGVPVAIFVISNVTKYPFELSGEDKKHALDDYKSDIGLDFFFIGISVIISTSIALYGVNIPTQTLIFVMIYSILSAAISRLYTLPWTDRRNLCLLCGLVLGGIAIVYALYSCLYLL